MNDISLSVIENNFKNITDEYKKFLEEKMSCRSCDIFNHYKTVVPSEGCVVNPIFMIVGESPGSDEVSSLRPFIGRAGQSMREQLEKRKDTFNEKTTLISNIIPCRPLDNKFPSDDKIAKNCMSLWLEREISIVKPKIIITLGNVSSFFIRGDYGISKIRGTWKYIDKYKSWCFSTFHPSFIIRNYQKNALSLWEKDWDHLAENWKDQIHYK